MTDQNQNVLTIRTNFDNELQFPDEQTKRIRELHLMRIFSDDRLLYLLSENNIPFDTNEFFIGANYNIEKEKCFYVYIKREKDRSDMKIINSTKHDTMYYMRANLPFEMEKAKFKLTPLYDLSKKINEQDEVESIRQEFDNLLDHNYLREVESLLCFASAVTINKKDYKVSKLE